MAVKYITALIISFVFAYGLTWLTGFSSNLMPAFGAHEWTKSNINISMFFANIYAYVIPLAIISLSIGFILGKVLKTKSTIIALLTAFFPLCFFIFPYTYQPLSEFELLHWLIEVPKILTIILSLIYAFNKFGIDSNT
ncbi:MAG: hypothetical protein P8I03_00725 [Thalassotalea sp.]|nr:hypothetical protein [Thalassotalea sp.]